jgi:esterase/lipase superfamily enzyme
MGARLLSWSLKDLYATRPPYERFAGVQFVAPDMDKDIFLQEVHFLKQACNSCRVYLDLHDSRLWLSAILHGSPRVSSNDTDDLSKLIQCSNSLPTHDSIPYAQLMAAMHQARSSN